MYTEINVADLAIQFFEILDRVEMGERFTILVDGKPAADIVPPAKEQKQLSGDTAAAA